MNHLVEQESIVASEQPLPLVVGSTHIAGDQESAFLSTEQPLAQLCSPALELHVGSLAPP